MDRHGDFRCLQEANLLPQDGTQIAIGVGLLLVGFLLVSFLDHLQSGSNPLFSLFWRRTQVATKS